MPANSLQELYVQKLQMMYDSEQQILQALPELIDRSNNDELRDALEHHRQQTEGHARRLEQVLQRRGERAKRSDCRSMRALIDEGQSTLSDIKDKDTIDAFIIAAAQSVEHHEMAAYGTARTWAEQLGFSDDADTLQQTLDEEGDADKKLTDIAEESVNQQASRGADREVQLGNRGQADRTRSTGRTTSGNEPTRRTDLDADGR
jgi:ferritin-like metal-binding protein YciE